MVLKKLVNEFSPVAAEVNEYLGFDLEFEVVEGDGRATSVAAAVHFVDRNVKKLTLQSAEVPGIAPGVTIELISQVDVRGGYRFAAIQFPGRAGSATT